MEESFDSSSVNGKNNKDCDLLLWSCSLRSYPCQKRTMEVLITCMNYFVLVAIKGEPVDYDEQGSKYSLLCSKILRDIHL